MKLRDTIKALAAHIKSKHAVPSVWLYFAAVRRDQDARETMDDIVVQAAGAPEVGAVSNGRQWGQRTSSS